MFFHSSICYLSTRQFVQHNRVCSLFNGRSVSTGDSAEISEGKWTAEPSVLLNSYASGVSFSRGRISRDPLPSRPDEETTRTENIAGHVYQNNRHEEDELRDVSIVLKNPDVQETLSRSLPRSRGDFPDLPEAHEQEELELGHQHHHHHRDVVDGKCVITIVVIKVTTHSCY